VFALDALTGRRIWTQPGRVPEGTESTDLVVIDAATGLAAYDPRTGASVWRGDAGVHFAAPMADGSARLIVRGDDLSIVDIHTGAHTSQGRLDSHSLPLFGFGDPLTVVATSMGVDGNQHFARGVRPTQPGSATWQHELSPELIRLSGYACGQWLCTTLGSSTSAVDPADGQRVWQADSEWVNHRTVRVDGTELLITIERGRTGPRTLLLDPRTGAVRMDLANWSPIGTYAGWQLVQWIPGSTYDPGWLGLLDPTAPGGVRALFPLGQVSRCSVAQSWLFCEVVSGIGQAGALRLDRDLIS
jgi:outer membrane protein assembly factor BamB